VYHDTSSKLKGTLPTTTVQRTTHEKLNSDQTLNEHYEPTIKTRNGINEEIKTRKHSQLQW